MANPAETRKAPLYCLFFAIALLFAIGVPWYWPASEIERQTGNAVNSETGAGSLGDVPLLFGLPTWFCVSVICSLLISILITIVASKYWTSLSGESSTGDQVS